jgi:hypothetical protein
VVAVSCGVRAFSSMSFRRSNLLVGLGEERRSLSLDKRGFKEVLVYFPLSLFILGEKKSDIKRCN